MWKQDPIAGMLSAFFTKHPPLATPADNALWTQVHVDFAHAAVNRSVVIAKGSGHFMMNDHPNLVAQAVIAAVNQVRHTTRP